MKKYKKIILLINSLILLATFIFNILMYVNRFCNNSNKSVCGGSVTSCPASIRPNFIISMGTKYLNLIGFGIISILAILILNIESDKTKVLIFMVILFICAITFIKNITFKKVCFSGKQNCDVNNEQECVLRNSFTKGDAALTNLLTSNTARNLPNNTSLGSNQDILDVIEDLNNPNIDFNNGMLVFNSISIAAIILVNVYFYIILKEKIE